MPHFLKFILNNFFFILDENVIQLYLYTTLIILKNLVYRYSAFIYKRLTKLLYYFYRVYYFYISFQF